VWYASSILSSESKERSVLISVKIEVTTSLGVGRSYEVEFSDHVPGDLPSQLRPTREAVDLLTKDAARAIKEAIAA